MSVPQGSTPYNELVVQNGIISINLASNCNQLTSLATNIVGSLNQTLAAVTAQYNAVTATLNQTEQDALNLYNQIAAIAGWQSSQTALSAQLTTASALTATDVGGIVSYLQAQAAAMITVNTTSLATIVEQLLALNSAYQTLNNDITKLTHQIDTLETQLTQLPESITAVTNAVQAAASKFENCVVPGF